MVDNPYEILGVSQGASLDEIKRAYRKKAKEYHPDLHPDDPRANEKMQQVNQAYDMLCNPDKYRSRQQARPDPGQYGHGGYTQPPYGDYAGQYRRQQAGGQRYTYYYSAGDDPNAWRRWQDAWSAQEDERQRAVVRNPFRSVLRFVGWMLLMRFLLSLLRFGFFI